MGRRFFFQPQRPLPPPKIDKKKKKKIPIPKDFLQCHVLTILTWFHLDACLVKITASNVLCLHVRRCEPKLHEGSNFRAPHELLRQHIDAFWNAEKMKPRGAAFHAFEKLAQQTRAHSAWVQDVDVDWLVSHASGS